MVDDTNAPGNGHAGAATPDPEAVVAYCQQCGRVLTAGTERRVGNDIFCEPCAVVRRGQTAEWTPVGTGTMPPAGTPGGVFGGIPGRATAAGEPNPTLAGFLGLIPGVGAMFNGQYAKGAIHLIVFVVLVSLADNLSWVLWWLVWGWIFYQAFEAYHTAQARRDGLPLPDPFGWNELGERMGFARTSSPMGSAAVPRSPGPSPAGFSTAQGNSRPADPATGPVTAGPGTADDAAAYRTGSGTPVPPSAPPPFPGDAEGRYEAPAAAAGTPETPFGASPYREVPYTRTYGGTVDPLSGPSTVMIGTRRFPMGAVWLIGLGTLFLLGNLLPNWHIDGRWLVPVLLTAVALWMAGSRIGSVRRSTGLAIPGVPQPTLAEGLMAPVLLLTIAALLAAQDASWISFRRSWPLLLIVWGGMLMVGRVRRITGPAFISGEPQVPTTSPDPTPRQTL